MPAAAASAPPPPPDAEYSIDDIARLSRVPVRTIRYYVKQRALEPPEFRSMHTRYSAEFLIRLRAIAALRRKKLRLDVIRPRLEAASREEILRLAGYEAPAGGGGGAPAGAADGSPRALPPGFLGPHRGASHPTERWEHMEICPGVKLLVRSEADGEAWRVAREIVALFAAR